MKKALITGITGQDGSLLADFLLKKNYKVVGIKRRSSSFNTQRIDHLYKDNVIKPKNKFQLVYGDLTDSSNILRLIDSVKPNEIYNLGAQSHVHTSFEIPEFTANVDAFGSLRILEAIRVLKLQKKTRYYQASTSEIFGNTEIPQNEKTPFKPASPYAVSKLYAYWTTVNYRNAYNIFAVNGILFNHEGPRRGKTFVSRKITRAVSEIYLKKRKFFTLGNLNAKRDWGHAKDYVEAMWLMLNADIPEDYVVSSGKTTSVREFIEKTLDRLDFEYEWTGEGINNTLIDKRENKVIIKIDKRLYRPAEVDLLIGDSSKIIDRLKWSPNYNLNTLIDDMVDFEINNSKFNF